MSDTGKGSSSDEREWILSNGAGTFAIGCVDRVPRRKYHSLFSLADGLGPQSHARNLVMDVVELVGEDGPEVRPLADPRGEITANRASVMYQAEPTPTWVYELATARLTRTLEVPSETEMPHVARPVVCVRYRLEPSRGAKSEKPAATGCLVEFEPWMLSRPLHMEMKLNTSLWGAPLPWSGRGTWRFQLYAHEPILRFTWKGIEPQWISQGRWETDVAHTWEAERGYTSTEDLFVPGRFGFMWNGRETLEFSLAIEWENLRPLIGEGELTMLSSQADSVSAQRRPWHANTVHRNFKTRLQQAARIYSAAIHERDALTPTLLAGFPWFGPWGRDILISIPGYALATHHAPQVYGIMAATGRRIRDGLIQGYMSGPDVTHRGPASVNFHGVDTPLLYVWALEHLQKHKILKDFQIGILREIACEIITAFARGAYPGVEVHADGRVRLETGLWAPTWMDARVEERPVTPRHGEPVDINALFANALSYLVEFEDEDARLPDTLRELAAVATKSMAPRYWKGELGYFADALASGSEDARLRPNQLWLMALDRIPIERAQAKAALQTVRENLLTPVGLRTLSPKDAAYRGRCEGNQKSRDVAYHQGTVWPWLLGIMGDALIRSEGIDAARTALAPSLKRLEYHFANEACIGQVSEIFDGDEPHRPRGAPAQAWSVMELVRLMEALGQ